MTRTSKSLKQRLNSGEFIIAPGIYDMIGAVVCNKVGFDFVYASGYWSTASAYGLPDAGISTFTQMLDRYSILCRTVNAGVIADADTGYGGLLNVHHTVKDFEAAGICAIQIEDQEFPKRCGHTPGKRVVETSAMVDKIKVACAPEKTQMRPSLLHEPMRGRQTDLRMRWIVASPLKRRARMLSLSKPCIRKTKCARPASLSISP